jgi:signal transduction histidine kinase
LAVKLPHDDLPKERAAAAVLDWIGRVVKHDLASPLGGLPTLLSTLERSPTLLAENAQYRGVAESLSAASSLARTVLETNETVAAPGALLEGILRDIFRFSGRSHGATYRVAPPPAVTLALPQSAFAVVIANLASNALKYQQPDRPLILGLTARLESGYWVLSVQDNGRGMDPSFAKEAFELGTREESGSAHGADGHGLDQGVGLHTVAKILRAHGGDVRVAQTERGVGTTFEVRVPIAGQRGDPRTARTIRTPTSR